MTIRALVGVLFFALMHSGAAHADEPTGGGQVVTNNLGENIALNNQRRKFDETEMIRDIVSAALVASGASANATPAMLDRQDAVDLEAWEETDQALFPVYKPRCADTAVLSEMTAALCEDFAWSAPLFPLISSTYVSKSSLWHPTGNGDLIGRTICHPRGEVGFLLRERGLSQLNARIVEGRSPADCLEQVASGAADAAVIAMLSYEDAARASGLTGLLAHVPELDLLLEVHAICPTRSARAVAQIEALDRGMAIIRQNGAWFDIIASHFGKYSGVTPRLAAVVQ